jgi:hypothetical protein
METTYDRLGVTTAVTWIEELASGAAGLFQDGADWAWNGSWQIADLAVRPARHVATAAVDEIAGMAKAHPYVAAVLAGAAGFGAATVIGLGELAAGVAIGYGTYLMLAKGEQPMRALGDAFALERGEEQAPAKRSTRARGRGARPRAAAGRKASRRRRRVE